MNDIDVKLPDKAKLIFDAKTKYITVYGGRASAKSTTVALVLLLKAMMKPTRVLCLRSVLLSINQSVHQLLKDCIKMINAEDFFDVQANKIVGRNGSEFMYAGLSNPANIKSYANVDLAYIEESDQVTTNQWEVLIPTLRNEGVQFYIVFNPCNAEDDTYKRFVVDNYYKENNTIIKMNYDDNPFLADTIKLEIELMKERDYDLFKHVYLGDIKKIADDIVFRRVETGTMHPDLNKGWDGPYLGMDFGYGGEDANCLVKAWVSPENVLYIQEAMHKSKVELVDLPAHMDRVTHSRKYVIRADSAMPLMISHIRREGFNIIAANKVSGSVEAGLYYLKSFDRIVIHPDLMEVYQEFKNLKWRKNKVGDLLPETNPLCHDHSCSALRYALQPLIDGTAKARKAIELEEQQVDYDIFGRPIPGRNKYTGVGKVI